MRICKLAGFSVACVLASYRVFTIIGAVLLLNASSFAQSFSFVTIDVPCSPAPPLNCPDGVAPRTALGGINPGGDIGGVYADGVGKQHGFRLSGYRLTTTGVPGTLALAGGEFATIDVPANLVQPGAHQMRPCPL